MQSPARGFVVNLLIYKMNRKIKANTADARTIDIDDAYALEFWAREFNVSQDKVKAAVLAAGTAAPDVKRELKK